MKANKKSTGLNHGYLFGGENKRLEGIPLPEYPRPQFKRDSYQCLNGLWDLKVTKEDILPTAYDRKVMVPFPVEAYDSRADLLPEPEDILFYHKVVIIDEALKKGRIVLHFDGVDQEATVYIDRKEVLTHIGMTSGFEVVLPENMPSQFDLVLKVKDRSDEIYHSRGKQALNPIYWSYTTTTGIYKPVWMESVPENRILSSVFTPDFKEEGVRVLVKTEKPCQITMKWKDKIYTFPSGEEKLFHFGNLRFWSMEDPYLYDVTLSNGDDEVLTYFAVRKIEIKEKNGFKKLYLNDKPLFLSGLLDQGYYGYNNLTPRSYEEFENDIRITKEMGFNCLRVHIKTECDYFYCLADKLGIYLIQDYPCGGDRYQLIRVGAPRVLNSFNRESHVTYRWLGRENEDGRKEFEEEALSYLERFHNHPSILIHTIFNEGWGEFDPSRIYRMLKEKENNVLFDTASGWYEADESDFYSVHTYSFPAMKRKNRFHRCFLISEAGGVGLKYGDVPFQKFTGHGKTKTKEKLMKKIRKLYLKQLLPQIKKYGLSGIIYTQLADVETEYNGLYDLTRAHCKIDIEEMKEINSKLMEENNKF